MNFKHQVRLGFLSAVTGFLGPLLLGASSAPASAPVNQYDPCISGWTSELYSTCFCVQTAFAITVDAANCGAGGENCEGTALWEVCAKAGQSGVHYLFCEDGTFVNVRCPFGGLAATVNITCTPCDM